MHMGKLVYSVTIEYSMLMIKIYAFLYKANAYTVLTEYEWTLG